MATAHDQTVGFVGIGNMGAPMVRALVKAGRKITIYDRQASATAPFKAVAGITLAGSLPELAAACRVIITMLPDSKIVAHAVLGGLGTPGLADGMQSGSLIIDMSSSDALATVALAAPLANLGAGLIDAPVSGGVPKAVTGTLAIMAGGDPVQIDRAVPVLSAMGTVHRTGKLGSGHAMKALNNYVSAAGLIATCEALLIGQKFGLDGAVMTRVLNASTGRNNTTENKAERYLLSGKFDSGFALTLMSKDVGMARALAQALGVPADELAFVANLLEKAAAALGPGADHTAVYRYVADAAAAPAKGA